MSAPLFAAPLDPGTRCLLCSVIDGRGHRFGSNFSFYGRCARCRWDIIGDALFLSEVIMNSSKDWIARLVTPYIVMFAIASVVSLFAHAVKSMLLSQTIRSRREGSNRRPYGGNRKKRRSSVGGVEVAPDLMTNASVVDLKEKFDAYKIERWSHVLYVLVAVFE